MPARPILFCTVGVHQTVGGIASASRNVLAALHRLGDETGRKVETLVLGEAGHGAPAYRTFAGHKIPFAVAELSQATRAALVVFDHVHLSVPVFVLPQKLRPKVVIFAHGWEAFRDPRPSSVRAFQSADLVLTNSQHTLGRMVRCLPKFTGEVCLLGLPPQFEGTPEPPDQSTDEIALQAVDGVTRALGSKVLLLVGRLDAEEREKGHRELIAVLPGLLRNFPDTQLVLVGGGTDMEPLAAIARSSAAATSIFMPGRMSEDGLEAVYRKAYAYVMPSRQEGFGLTYLEAMNYAKPCLACHDDGGADVVVNGQTGVLVAHDIDQGELLGALEFLLGDPVRARKYGEAGWRRLNQLFTSAAHQDRVVQRLRPLLGDGQS